MVRQRHPPTKIDSSQDIYASPSVDVLRRKQARAAVERGGEGPGRPDPGDTTTMSWRERNQNWIGLAVASGACAAFNGVFAKLTTTDLTTNIATAIANLLGLAHHESWVEFIVRSGFFVLNLIFNGVMWTFFTAALAKGHSTTQVSIMNTSTNFVLTALLGLAIFSESLPPLWWVGAAMLVAGNVIIGRKDEGGDETNGPPEAARLDETTPFQGNVENTGPKDDEDVVDLGDVPHGP